MPPDRVFHLESPTSIRPQECRWDLLAERTLEVFAKLAPPAPARAGRPYARSPRPRVAFFTPLPPRASEVSDYSERLLAELKRDYAIDVYHDQGDLPATSLALEEFGSFDAYLATMVPGPPARLAPTATGADVPITTPGSDALSKDLKRRGFRFVGSTIVYSFMQSVGLVDDHVPGCFRYGVTR